VELKPERRLKVLEFIEKHPDCTISDLAKGFNISDLLAAAYLSRYHKKGYLIRRKATHKDSDVSPTYTFSKYSLGKDGHKTLEYWRRRLEEEVQGIIRPPSIE